jgi:hypothetical protein|tara:strand:- start:53 stop:268 length:216 start_codon:yes stop_codon:yes gene_type:complete
MDINRIMKKQKKGDWRPKRVGYVEDFSERSLQIIENILDNKSDPLAWKPKLMSVNVQNVDVPYLDFINKCK